MNSAHPEKKVEFLSPSRVRLLLWSVLFAAAGYLCFVLWIGWKDVALAVARVGMLGVAVALALSLVNYCFRFVRWQAYLKAMDCALPWKSSLRIYLAGFSLTTTPGKAGEALRGVLLKQWGLPYSKSLGAFLSERLSDLLAIVLLTMVGLSTYPAARPIVAGGAALVVLVFVALFNHRFLESFFLRVGTKYRAALSFHKAVAVLAQARRCHSPALLLSSTALSCTAWAAEAYALHLLLMWMGFEVPLPISTFVYAVSMLAGAISFLPGGLGSTEAVMVALLIWAGVGSGDAVAATLLIRLTTLWFAVVIGVIAVVVGDDAHKPKPQAVS